MMMLLALVALSDGASRARNVMRTRLGATGRDALVQRSDAGAPDGAAPQNSALRGARGKGMTSRMFFMPVTYISARSNPRPKPACGTVP